MHSIQIEVFDSLWKSFEAEILNPCNHKKKPRRIAARRGTYLTFLRKIIMANVYVFTAAIKRDGQQARNIPNCTTYEGFLCGVKGSKLIPFFDSMALDRAGVSRDQVAGIETVQAAIAAGYSEYLIKFGKQPGYWVWNVEAADRKKIETEKTVWIYEKKQASWDDDEPELRMTHKPYPEAVWAAINPHIIKDRNGYEIVNYAAMKAALARIGWKLNK